jgi:Lactate racemase N-terminal domain
VIGTDGGHDGRTQSAAVAVEGIRAPGHAPMPRLVRVHQAFTTPGRCDVEADIHRQIDAPDIARRIPRGRVAVAVGSRGVAEIPLITKAVVSALRRHGAQPFIVPAMGSHGGATAEGQREVLAGLGVTEASAGAPIVSSMEVVELGRLADGSGVFWDREAHQAGAAVAVGRVKPHTAFRGGIESGLVKMAVIGIGKQRGAQSMHAPGFGEFAARLIEGYGIVAQRAPLLFGVATVEDAYDVPVEVAVLPPEAFLSHEPALLERARSLMPRLPVAEADVLVVQEIGKNISGDGMDPNITGRYPTPFASGGPTFRKIAVLDLTAETQGNANGVGMAELIAQRVLEKMDLRATYMNALTSTVIDSVRLPMVLATDRDVLDAAVLTAPRIDGGETRLVYIRNTLAVADVAVSEALVPALLPHAHAAAGAAPTLLEFTERGALRAPLDPVSAAGRADKEVREGGPGVPRRRDPGNF